MAVDELILKVLENSPIAAVLLWFIIQQRKDNSAFIDRNNKLVDTQIENANKISDNLTPVLVRNTLALERIERRLDESPR